MSKKNINYDILTNSRQNFKKRESIVITIEDIEECVEKPSRKEASSEI